MHVNVARVTPSPLPLHTHSRHAGMPSGGTHPGTVYQWCCDVAASTPTDNTIGEAVRQYESSEFPAFMNGELFAKSWNASTEFAQLLPAAFRAVDAPGWRKLAQMWAACESAGALLYSSLMRVSIASSSSTLPAPPTPGSLPKPSLDAQPHDTYAWLSLVADKVGCAQWPPTATRVAALLSLLDGAALYLLCAGDSERQQVWKHLHMADAGWGALATRFCKLVGDGTSQRAVWAKVLALAANNCGWEWCCFFRHSSPT